MHHIFNRKNRFVAGFTLTAFVLGAAIFLTGCKKDTDTPVPPEDTTSGTIAVPVTVIGVCSRKEAPPVENLKLPTDDSTDKATFDKIFEKSPETKDFITNFPQALPKYLDDSHPKGEPNKPLEKEQKDDLAFKIFSAVLSVAIMAVCCYFGCPFVGLTLISILASAGVIDSGTASTVQTVASQSIDANGNFDADKFGTAFTNEALKQIEKKYDIPADLKNIVLGLKDGKLPDGFDEKDAFKLLKDISRINGVKEDGIRTMENLYKVGKMIPNAFSLLQDWLNQKITLDELGKKLESINPEAGKKIMEISDKINHYRTTGKIERDIFKKIYEEVKNLSGGAVPSETIKGLVRGFAITEADRKLADEAMDEVDKE